MDENSKISFKNHYATNPFGLIVLESSRELGEKINKHLLEITGELNPEENSRSYIIPIDEVRFSNGDGKVVLKDSVRGKELFIICDVGNYGCTYNMYGMVNHKSPDDHLQDIKRVLSAISGKAKKITLIMPLLYAGRQHKRRKRESLDCAIALQELERMGVNSIITFDAHDPNVQNAIPLISFDNLYPTYEIVKAIIREDRELVVDKNNTLVISPDTGAMDRAIYYSSVLGLDIGLFYKRRDYSIVISGKNPIVQHEYMGKEVEGKNILIIDDMISSGESVFDIALELKRRKANKIIIATTFALFTDGIAKFEDFYNKGIIHKVYSTNLTYKPQRVKESCWFKEVDLSGFIVKIIEHVYLGKSIEYILDGKDVIDDIWKKR